MVSLRYIYVCIPLYVYRCIVLVKVITYISYCSCRNLFHNAIAKVVGSSFVKTRKIMDFHHCHTCIYLCGPLCFLLIAGFLYVLGLETRNKIQLMDLWHIFNCVHKIYGSGLNVKFKGRKAINLPPASITSIQVTDEGRISHIDVANVHCSKCEGHVGWKIVRIIVPLLWILCFTLALDI